MVFPLTSVKLIKADSRHALLLKLEMCLVSKSLLDSVDFTRYVDPDLFDLGLLTQYFLRDGEEEELFAEAAVQLPKVVAEAEIDEIFSQAAFSIVSASSYTVLLLLSLLSITAWTMA